MYVNSLKKGRVEMEGKYLEDMNDYQFKKLELKFMEGNERKTLDLLV